MTVKDLERYHAAAHAMQTGVKAEQEQGSDDGTPKHLRVGVNAALVGNSALASLLIDKGVITLDEYQRAQADEMETEQQRYEGRLRVKLA